MRPTDEELLAIADRIRGKALCRCDECNGAAIGELRTLYRMGKEDFRAAVLAGFAEHDEDPHGSGPLEMFIRALEVE